MNGKTKASLTFGQSTHTISIPIEARSIFRLLAIGPVVRNQNFVKFLADDLDEILRAIQPTERLTERDNSTKVKDFLGYGSKHNGGNCTDFEKCSEQELCKSKEAFFKNKKQYAGTLGDVFDYQVPLASSRDAGEGVIDMLSLRYGSIPTIYVIEVKKWDSDEHPLRAMFEALTFWRLLSDEGSNELERGQSFCAPLPCQRFIDRYNKSAFSNHQLPDNATIVPAILVCEGSRIYSQMMPKEPPDGELRALYGKILGKGLRCFRYKRKQDDKKILVVEDFTEEFAKNMACKSI
jgi:hypothetical protein